MAKKAITQPSYATNNVEQLPAVVVGDETAIQTVFDKVGVDTKTYLVSLTAELNGLEGAEKIGLLNPNLAALSVGDGIEEVRLVAVQAQAGTIVANSIDDTKLVADIKVGSLATLTTTEKLSVTGAINEIDADLSTLSSTVSGVSSVASSNTVNLSMLREAKATTGSAVAYVLDTAGTFDLTVDGNRLMFRPNVANSGSATLAVDGTVVGLRKINDSGSPVVLEANDLKQGVPVEFVRSVSDNFFILRPSGGSNIKSIQRGEVIIGVGSNPSNITISSVDLTKSIVKVTYETIDGGANTPATLYPMAKLTTSTNLYIQKNTDSNQIRVYWEVVEFKNVKSLQSGEVTISTNPTNVTISSVNMSKSILFTSFKSASTSTASEFYVGAKLSSATQVTFTCPVTSTSVVYYYVIEFN